MPPSPLHDKVYVVVWFGLTETEPFVLTEPTPLSIEQEEALELLHERMDEPPRSPLIIGEGDAEKLFIDGGW